MLAYREFLDDLLKGYQNCYDIERVESPEEGGDLPLVAKAHFHLMESQCVVFKEFSMWTAESDEYVFIFHAHQFTEEMAEKIIRYTQEVGFPLIELDRVNMKRQHMCTRLVAVVLSENVSKEAEKCFKKCRVYKNFNFSLKGWMEMHTVTVNLQEEKVTGNRYSRATVKFIKELISHIKRRANIKLA